MKQYCRSHPTQLSHWHCPKCNHSYCPQCILVRTKSDYTPGEKLHLCPNCVFPVEWIGAANTIVPFWNRLHKHFIYPLALHPMVLLTVITIFKMFTAGGRFGFVFNILLWGVLIKYSFVVLKETAKGRLVPPKVSLQTISEDFSDAFKWLAIFVAIYFVLFMIGQRLGHIPAMIFLVFAIISLPAMIILFISTGSLANALNPMLFVSLIFRIGWGYALMYLFLFFLSGAPYALGMLLVNVLPPKLFTFLYEFASAYYTIIFFNLMGYVLLQYHQAIGYKIEYNDFVSPDTPATAIPEMANPEIDTINQLNQILKSGNFDKALDFLRDYTQVTIIQDVKLSEKYYELLVMKKRHDELGKHLPNHLNLMVKNNKPAKSLQLYHKCLEYDKGFTPSVEVLFKIGEWLNETGKSNEAIQAFRTLVNNYPDNLLVPKAFFRAAQIFHDRLMDPQKAKEILNDIINNYPTSDIIPQVKNYLAHLST